MLRKTTPTLSPAKSPTLSPTKSQAKDLHHKTSLGAPPSLEKSRDLKNMPVGIDKKTPQSV